MSIDYNFVIRNQTIEIDFDRDQVVFNYLVYVSNLVNGTLRIYNNETNKIPRVQVYTINGGYNNVNIIARDDLSRHCIKISGDNGIVKYYLDDSLISTKDLSSQLPSSFLYPLLLRLGSNSEAKCKLYGLRIYDTATGEIRVNLRPAIRLADLKYGLYDEVRDIFFTDPALTGG